MDHNKLWKILKEIKVSDHLTCLLRSLSADQEATWSKGRGTKDWFKIGKGACQRCALSLCLFNLYAELFFSCSAVFDSLQPHGLQHIRLPCPSLSQRVCSNSCLLSQ